MTACSSDGLSITTDAAPTGPMFVQKSPANFNGDVAATSFTATLPVAATAGNLLIGLFVTRDDVNVPATPAGWTAVAVPQDTHFTGYAAMFYKVAAGGETDITCTSTLSRFGGVAIEEWTGTTATPLDAATVAAGSVNPDVNTEVITCAAAPSTTKSVVFAFAGITGWPADSYSSWSNGFVNEYQAEGPDGQTALLLASHVYSSIPGSPPTTTVSFTNIIKAATFAAAFKGT